jgi:HK97 gp10 family phage protein
MMEMNLEGLDEVKRLLNAFKVKKGVESAVREAAFKIAGDAKDAAPVDTGRLRGSIRPESVMVNASEIVGRISANTEYAVYVEFGTGQRGEASPAPPKSPEEADYTHEWAGMAARPFLYPAFKENKEWAAEKVRNAVLRALKGV